MLIHHEDFLSSQQEDRYGEQAPCFWGNSVALILFLQMFCKEVPNLPQPELLP